MPIRRVASHRDGADASDAGWYWDPDGYRLQRYWDGTEWTDLIRDPSARGRSRNYFGALILVLALGAALAISLWTVSYSSVGCGNAFHAASLDVSSVDSYIPDLGDQEANDTASSIAEGLAQGCKDAGKDRLTIAGWIVIGGLVVGFSVNRAERRAAL